MNELVKQIQQEVDSIMNWKFAKKTDKWLESFPQMVDGGKLTAQIGKESQAVKVDQYDLDGNYIQTFDSVRDAAKFACVDRTAIRRVCQGKQKKSAGFIWKYHE